VSKNVVPRIAVKGLPDTVRAGFGIDAPDQILACRNWALAAVPEREPIVALGAF
jgi:hypothetical protein